MIAKIYIDNSGIRVRNPVTLKQIDENPETPHQEDIAMRSLISKSIAIAAISLVSFPALAMDSVVIERFYMQNQSPLYTGHEGASESDLERVTVENGGSQHEGQKAKMGNHDRQRLSFEGSRVHIESSRVHAIDK